jgi:hypothetical protein
LRQFIVVTLPGTSFRAAYFKSSDNPWLMQSNYMADDAEAPISRTEFHALAWRAANEKARELGWIV